MVPAGGSIALNTPTPGTLTPAGAIDDWTFYGTAGESITVQLNPGERRFEPGRLAATSTGARSSLLNASGNSLATASSASSGAFATISGFALPASGTYTIQVQAPSAESSSTGNYVLSVYNVTPSVSSLTVNQEYTGTIGTALRRRSSMTSPPPPAQQVQLDVIGSSGRSRVRPDRARGLDGVHRPRRPARA